MKSKSLANTHFWLATLGIILWAVPMYIAGFMQSMEWKEMTPAGQLANPNFLKTVTQLKELYVLRALGMKDELAHSSIRFAYF